MMERMDDLVQFLRDRLDDDERVARAATPSPWKVDDTTFTESIDASGGVSVISGSRYGGGSPPVATGDALHIVRHDPARVLAEVEAKRRLLDLHSTPHTVVDGFCVEDGGPCTHQGEAECTLCGETGCTTLRLLALPYADHPDYRDDWRP